MTLLLFLQLLSATNSFASVYWHLTLLLCLSKNLIFHFLFVKDFTGRKMCKIVTSLRRAPKWKWESTFFWAKGGDYSLLMQYWLFEKSSFHLLFLLMGSTCASILEAKGGGDYSIHQISLSRVNSSYIYQMLSAIFTYFILILYIYHYSDIAALIGYGLYFP